MFRGIEHTAIASPDPPKLAEWYVERMDFRVNYRSEANKTLFLRAPDGSMIEMIESAGARDRSGDKDPGLRHLAIAVSDFDAAYQRLRAAGVEFVSEPVTAGTNRIVFFKDPEGNLLHLIYRQVPLP